MEPERLFRSSADQLAVALFEVLRELPVSDRRVVFDALTAVEMPASSARVLLARSSLQRCAAELGVTPSKGRYESWRLALGESGVPSASFVARTFKQSWTAAVDDAGLEPAADMRAVRMGQTVKQANDEVLLDGLRRCYEELGGAFTLTEYRAWAREAIRRPGGPVGLPVTQHVFARRFGSFAQAMRMAGVPVSRRSWKPRKGVYTREMALETVREAARDVAPLALTMAAFDDWRSWKLQAAEEAGEACMVLSRNALRGWFDGSWHKLLEAAGLIEPGRHVHQSERRGRRWGAATVADALMLAVREFGPGVTRGEYESWRRERAGGPYGPRLPSDSMIRMRFGWARARQLAHHAITEGLTAAQLGEQLLQAEAEK